MTSNSSVEVDRVSKTYMVTKAERETMMHQAILKRLRHPTRGSVDHFSALTDVSFQAQPGDVVGIIGRNGAGKSTLLKILSRITEPSAGRVELRGRVGSLLEIGTGFHPELTGLENIYLNGAILGMRKQEIRSQLDAIVEFSGIQAFLRTPVKRYSSGMYVRLAFAVAAHLNPEILLVDEVLAVGDVEFQKKCIGKMQSVASQEERTVLFVSHNIAAVQQLCSRTILMDLGKIVYDGNTTEALRRYVALHRSNAISEGVFLLDQRSNPDGPNEPLYLRSLTITENGTPTAALHTGDSSAFTVECEGIGAFTEPYFRVSIRNELDQVVFVSDSRMADDPPRGPRVTFAVEHLPLLPGRYFVDVGVAASDARTVLDHVIGAATFDVLPSTVYATDYRILPQDANVYVPPLWRASDPQ
jgi:lipopolysaccharide transport system ATP-binding protein